MRQPLMRHPSKMRLSTSPDMGRSIAISAVTFLASDAGRLDKFLSITGLGPHSLRKAADEAGFFSAVLEYMLADEALLVAFAVEAGLEPELVARAQETLACRPNPSEP
jgi:hypothetical protein